MLLYLLVLSIPQSTNSTTPADKSFFAPEGNGLANAFVQTTSTMRTTPPTTNFTSNASTTTTPSQDQSTTTDKTFGSEIYIIPIVACISLVVMSLIAYKLYKLNKSERLWKLRTSTFNSGFYQRKSKFNFLKRKKKTSGGISPISPI